MFDEGQLYSPVSRTGDGTAEVHLGATHPGVADPEYRARRNEIAAAALEWTPGQPLPKIAYTDVENGVWATVCEALAPKHEAHAHPEFLAAKAALGLPTDRVPTLDEVSALLEPLTGFSYVAAPGLVALRQFYGSLGRRVFHSTQYLRHPSTPLYTPEPDIIHEVIGHGNQLASPRFAAVTEAAGQATLRLEDDANVKFVADVFWFSMEFGVMYSGSDLKAYGAGILSSFGEMDEFAHMEIRPLDLYEMGTLNYDITAYQPILFAARSVDELEDVVGEFFATCDDDSVARLRASESVPA